MGGSIQNITDSILLDLRKEEVRNLHAEGVAHYKKGSYAEAIAVILPTLEFFKSLDSCREDLAIATFTLGRCYQNLGNHLKAKEFFSQSHALRVVCYGEHAEKTQKCKTALQEIEQAMQVGVDGSGVKASNSSSTPFATQGNEKSKSSSQEQFAQP